MSWWHPEPGIFRGESDVWRVPVNVRKGWRAVGGMLYVTADLAMFQPNRLDRAVGATGWTIPLRELVDVRPVAGTRRQLVVDAVDGTSYQVVARDRDELLRHLTGRRRGRSAT